jgi:hypothetical protein
MKDKETMLDTASLIALENRANEIIKGIKYVIGIDTADGTNLSYCLMRKEEHDKSTHLILAKTLNDKQSFEEETKNLAKYFNACILKEENKSK